MSEEEIEDLLEIGCCHYHMEVGEKANKEIKKLNEFLRAFSDFIDDEEYWKQLGNNGEEIEIKVSHKWNELLKDIVYGSDKE